MPNPTYTPENFKRLPNKEAIVSFEGKTLFTSFHYLDVLAQEHAVAFTVAKMMDEDMLAEVRNAILDAQKNGTGFADFQKRLVPYLQSRGWWGEQVMGDPKDGVIKKVQLGSTRRLRTIYHTNMHASYAAGQWQRIQETKEYLPYLQYMESTSENKRIDHKKYYNLVKPADDEIWKVIFPPNEYGCKCWVKQLTLKQAEEIGISDDFELELEEVENKRTGTTDIVHKGINPSFAHNHDMLTAIMKIAEEKHGERFADLTKMQMEDYIMKLLVSDSIDVIDFANIAVIKKEAERLSQELDNQKPSIEEGIVADKWQQYYGVNLVRYDESKHKVLVENKKADFAEQNSQPPDEWKTLDFMFTMSEEQTEGFYNDIFEHKKKAKKWRILKEGIKSHIAKADVVPMDLSNLNPRLRIKIILFVLSLSSKQRAKVKFITGNQR